MGENERTSSFEIMCVGACCAPALLLGIIGIFSPSLPLVVIAVALVFSVVSLLYL